MKMYRFNPNDHGSQYFVLAKSERAAIRHLLVYLEKQANRSSLYVDELKNWKNAIPFRPATYPKGYTIDVIDIGEVIESEIA